MSAAVFLRCSLIAFGPALAPDFFWLVLLLLSSLVHCSANWWEQQYINNEKSLLIFGVVFSLLLQKVFWFAYYKLLKKANKGLISISQEETIHISVRQLSYVSGCGFGIMSGVFSLVNVLTDSLGPGTVDIYGDSLQYFLSSAFMTLSIVVLHVFWSIVFFDACEKKKWWALARVILSHLLVAGLTFLNPQSEGSLVPSYIPSSQPAPQITYKLLDFTLPSLYIFSENTTGVFLTFLELRRS